ncbi:Conserved hypothetical protein [Theileria orientalis strain Shintoku]|uniref:Reticulon-like protein n=1 Tax=Theileria orientalis strain Shintoku TaxID=869250 RepID=J4DNQ7_THEOR|nr:Conserved hypothetical protein [Theileria orientalis strain Shintoku]PVC54822.1 hypothetical protein MACL_00003573 [Theileria orientalis]BAM39379.1 Conserved hypothetical protein [Theileria orientalis strain Shintoku]|eukprot:XP_009689680.1 Conserved hypothetical protein [Theileria orientalis strain Shintoku]
MDKQSCFVPFVLLVGFNILQFSTYVLKVPPLFLVCKILVLFVVFGGLLKTLLGDKLKAKSDLVNEVVSQRNLEKATKALCSNVNLFANKLLSVIVWEDSVNSLVSLVGFYLLGLLLKVVPSVLVTFVLLWVLFLHVYMNDFLKKRVFIHLDPHVKKLKELVKKNYHTIPRFRENKTL